jgi:hypothetical protein
MARSGLELDLTAGGGAAPKPRVGSPALGKLGSVLIAATPGPASAADAAVVVENGHDQDATVPTGLSQLKSPAKSVRLVIRSRGPLKVDFRQACGSTVPTHTRPRAARRAAAPGTRFIWV